jgi:hypothetical protein
VPGAGAEILVERVRKIIAPKKTSTERWLDVHRKVHEAGLRARATMMFGHVETAAERIEHLGACATCRTRRAASPRSRAGTMQPAGVPEEEKYPKKTTPGVYLRVQAISRIVLDNIDNMQTSYVTQGLKMAQVTLRYGCNDFGGTMLEENVVSAAGCFHLASIERIERQIERAGFRAAAAELVVRNRRSAACGARAPAIARQRRRTARRRKPSARRRGGRRGADAAPSAAEMDAIAKESRRAPGPEFRRMTQVATPALRTLARGNGLSDVADKVLAGERPVARGRPAALPRRRARGRRAREPRARADARRRRVLQREPARQLHEHLQQAVQVLRVPAPAGTGGRVLVDARAVRREDREHLHEPVTEVHMVAGSTRSSSTTTTSSSCAR